MTEQSTEQLTAFGRVLVELLEEKGVEDLKALEELAREKGVELDIDAIAGRMRDKDWYTGPLGDLADVLDLGLRERLRMAQAYAFEQGGGA